MKYEKSASWAEFVVVFLFLGMLCGGWLLPLWIAAGCP